MQFVPFEWMERRLVDAGSSKSVDREKTHEMREQDLRTVDFEVVG